MRVLGVDPGLTRCGLGVVDGAPGRPLIMVCTDVARTPPDAGIGDRLLAIEQQIEEWLIAYRPDAVAVERVFSQHNVRTVMGTAQAGAVAIVCAARHGIPVALHTPSEVKAAVTGNGRADKAQVTAMVTRLLRLADAPRPADAADALALAICHIWRGGAQARLTAAQAQAAPAQTAPAQAAQVRAAQVRAAQVRTAQVRAGTARAGTEQAALRRAGWGQAGGPR
jgi:crossover junction endodeoxyribonuclease RuvC